MKKTLIGIFLLTFLLAGCDRTLIREPVMDEEVLKNLNPTYKVIELSIPKQVNHSYLEPSQGIYTGVYAENNTDLDNSIKAFEALTGQKQALRVMQYKDNEDITSRQMLQCLANKQTPYIKVLMSEDYDITPIYNLVGDIQTRYEMPVWIELFPINQTKMDPVAYKKYYEDAYKIIKKYLDQAVVVWSCSADTIYDSMVYYPGDNVVDWIGLNVYEETGELHKTDNESFKKAFDFWYKNFQEHKPLLFSGLALSHYSRTTSTYTTEETIKRLGYFYEEVPQYYPRIKAILYMDVDMSELGTGGKQDYRISSQKELAEAYSQWIGSGPFLHEIIIDKPHSSKEHMKYTVPVLEVEEQQYMSKDYASKLFNIVDLKSIPYIEYTDQNKYYNVTDLLSAYNLKLN